MCSCAERTHRLPKLRLLLLIGGVLTSLVSVTGCARQQPQQATPPPMIIDEAMQKRDWEPSVAYIPSGDVVAGVNRFPLRSGGEYTEGGTPDYAGAALDYGAHLVQTLALPFTYLFVPPFEPQVYRDEEIGPSYTGMPQMRPARQPQRVDDIEVDPDTLEVLPGRRSMEQQMEDHRRQGPLGPGDTEFMSSPPSPARN